MNRETPQVSLVLTSCLVQIRAEPAGQFTAHLVGQSEFAATRRPARRPSSSCAPCSSSSFDEGSLRWVEFRGKIRLMRPFGYAKDDPDFEAIWKKSASFGKRWISVSTRPGRG